MRLFRAVKCLRAIRRLELRRFKVGPSTGMVRTFRLFRGLNLLVKALTLDS